MKAYQVVLTLGLTLWTGLASAQSVSRAFDINLNDDAVRASFTWPPGAGNLLADVGYLHNQDRGDVFQAGLHLVDAAANSGNALQAGLGLKFVYTNTDPSAFDGSSVALGGFFRYTFPNANRFNVGGSVYYAPDVVSFGDQSEFYEVGIRFGYNVLRDADVYVGFREVKAEYDDAGRFEFDSSAHVGFEIRF